MRTVSTPQGLRQISAAHSLCIIIGERFAGQWVNTVREEAGPFEEVIMGARIQGTQKTRARTSIDFQPSDSAARMQIVLNGVTNSQTVAQTPQAAIRSEGNYEFQLTKQIEFDGEVARTWSPAAFMTIRQRNVGAATPVSAIPLLGPLASNIALGVADQRRPMTEMIAAHRVTQSIAPEFNSRLDKELADLNHKYSHDAKGTLEHYKLIPSDLSLLTTDEAVLIGAAFGGSAFGDNASRDSVKAISRGHDAGTKAIPIRQSLPMPIEDAQFGLEAAPAPFSLDPAAVRDQAVILIHDSLAADLAERFHLAGLELPDTALQRLTGSASAAGTAPQMYTLIFAKEQPLSLVFDEGEIHIVLRVGIRPVVGPELPMQAITIAIRLTMQPDLIELHPEIRSIEPLQPGDKLPAMAESLIRQGIGQKLKDFNLPQNLFAPREAGKPSIPITVKGLSTRNGWLMATLQAVSPAGSPLAEESDDDFLTR